MKKLCYILLLVFVILVGFWYIEYLKVQTYLEIEALTNVLHLQQEEIQKLKQEIENKEVEVEQLLDEIERLRTIRARVTAYAPLDNKSGICADNNPTITSRGTLSRRGVIAVDPRKIPYFTLVYVPGYGIASAEDTGAILRQYDGVAIDVLVDTHEEAMEWGIQYLDVTILVSNK